MFFEGPVKPPKLERPVNVQDPATRAIIIGFVADMVDDLLTDPRWAHDMSDKMRAYIASNVRQGQFRCHNVSVEDRIARALQDLHLTVDEKRQFLDDRLIAN